MTFQGSPQTGLQVAAVTAALRQCARPAVAVMPDRSIRAADLGDDPMSGLLRLIGDAIWGIGFMVGQTQCVGWFGTPGGQVGQVNTVGNRVRNWVARRPVDADPVVGVCVITGAVDDSGPTGVPAGVASQVLHSVFAAAAGYTPN